jgi:phospholipid N-methyltransferase
VAGKVFFMLQLMDHAIADRLRFFYSFLRSPRTVGSVTPSSRFLARAMLKEVDWARTEIVVELGAGTGVFTEGIKKLARSGAKKMIFEKDPHLRERLIRRFPDFIIGDNACELIPSLADNGIEPGQVDVILSGLPFAVLPQPLRDQILTGVYRALKPDGIFITFQYSLQMRKQLLDRFHTVDLSFVPFNLPPAFVYHCRKKG